MTVPALPALDLYGEVEGDGIDRVLRTRTATLAGMHRAFSEVVLSDIRAAITIRRRRFPGRR